MKGKDADETLKHSSSNLWIKTDILKSQKKHITAAMHNSRNLDYHSHSSCGITTVDMHNTYNLVTSLLKILPCLFKDKALFLIWHTRASIINLPPFKTHLTHVQSAKSCLTHCNPTVAHQPPLSLGFSKQEYWSGFPLPPPGDLPDPGIKPKSPVLQVDSLPLSHLGSPSSHTTHYLTLN